MLRVVIGAVGLQWASGSYSSIANYRPETNVVPHSLLDLDMAEVVAACKAGDFAQALFVYDNGGGGLCSQADIATSDTSSSCYGKTTAHAKGNSIKGSGAIRTLKGFATSGAAKMTSEKWWPVFSNYWGDENYADTFVRSALTDGSMSTVMRGELAMKGAAYQAVWMYVLHEFEDAITDCLNGDIFANEATNEAGDSPHAWDEGWAFMAGSLEGPVGDGDGAMLHALAEKRCANFGTCAAGLVGAAHANLNAASSARTGRDKILLGDCYSVTHEFESIVDQLTLPLLQGLLRYAFKADPSNLFGSCMSGECDKEWAEGWAFAAAVLPRLHYCDAGVASLVRENLDVANPTPMASGFKVVKLALESTYACLGLTCADVGELQNSVGVYEGMEACVDPEPAQPNSSKSKKTTVRIDTIPTIILAILAGAALLATGAFFHFWRKAEAKLERAELTNPIYLRNSNKEIEMEA